MIIPSLVTTLSDLSESSSNMATHDDFILKTSIDITSFTPQKSLPDIDFEVKNTGTTIAKKPKA